MQEVIDAISRFYRDKYVDKLWQINSIVVNYINVFPEIVTNFVSVVLKTASKHDTGNFNLETLILATATMEAIDMTRKMWPGFTDSVFLNRWTELSILQQMSMRKYLRAEDSFVKYANSNDLEELQELRRTVNGVSPTKYMPSVNDGGETLKHMLVYIILEGNNTYYRNDMDDVADEYEKYVNMAEVVNIVERIKSESKLVDKLVRRGNSSKDAIAEYLGSAKDEGEVLYMLTELRKSKLSHYALELLLERKPSISVRDYFLAGYTLDSAQISEELMALIVNYTNIWPAWQIDTILGAITENGGATMEQYAMIAAGLSGYFCLPQVEDSLRTIIVEKIDYSENEIGECNIFINAIMNAVNSLPIVKFLIGLNKLNIADNDNEVLHAVIMRDFNSEMLQEVVESDVRVCFPKDQIWSSLMIQHLYYTADSSTGWQDNRLRILLDAYGLVSAKVTVMSDTEDTHGVIRDTILRDTRIVVKNATTEERTYRILRHGMTILDACMLQDVAVEDLYRSLDYVGQLLLSGESYSKYMNMSTQDLAAILTANKIMKPSWQVQVSKLQAVLLLILKDGDEYDPSETYHIKRYVHVALLKANDLL